MHLHPLDIAIILVYLLGTVLVGYWVSHYGSRDMTAYFLGGNKMPWYVLGMSNASGMFDISGTMLLVYWMFVYGLKSVWIPWLWPTFNQVFLMVYSVGVAAALQGHDRSRVDQDAFRHRPRRPVVAPDRCDLMPSSASSGSSPTASRASASSRPRFCPGTCRRTSTRSSS
jgi:hypothetical protein